MREDPRVQGRTRIKDLGGTQVLLVLLFFLAWVGPGLLPGKRLTPDGYLGFAGVWRTAAPRNLPIPPVIVDESCNFMDYPGFLYANAQLRAGRVPLVLPVGADISFLSVPQLAPGSLWHAPVLLTGSLAVHSWVLVLRNLLAAALGWLLASRLGLRSWGRVVVAVSAGAAGMMAAHFPLTSPASITLFPLLLVLAEVCARRRSWESAILFGAVSGLAPLWGHPEPAFVIVLGAGLWWALRELSTGATSPGMLAHLARRAGYAAGCCALVSMPVLLPFLVTLPDSVSYKLDVHATSAQRLASVVLLAALAGALVCVCSQRMRASAGAFLATPRRRRLWGLLLLAALTPLSVWLDPYARTNVVAFPAGHAISVSERLLSPSHLQFFYPGLVCLPFLSAGWKRLRELRVPLAGLILLGLGVGWSIPPFDLLRLLPVLSTLSAPYGAVLLTLPVAILAAAGLESLAGAPVSLAVRATVGTALAGAWHVLRARADMAMDDVMLEPRALVAAVVLLLFAVAIWILRDRSREIAVSVLLLDLFLHAYPYARPTPAFDYPKTPAIEAVEHLLAEGGRFVAVTDRHRPVPNVFPPGTGAAFGLRDVRMAGAMRPAALAGLWEEVGIQPLHPNLLLTDQVDALVWDLLDVRAVLTGPGVPVPDRYELVYGDNFVSVYSRTPIRAEGDQLTLVMAQTDAGVQFIERDLGERRPPTLVMHAAPDRWAGIFGPLFLLSGLLFLLAALLKLRRAAR